MRPPARPTAREWQRRALAGRIEDALLHFEIGSRTHTAGLYVDWASVASCMARVLSGGEADTLYTPSRARQREREEGA